MQRSGGVDAILEGGGEVPDGIRFGTARAGRRHHAGAKLVNHPLRDFGVLLCAAGVEIHQRQATGLALLAVAADAILLDEIGRRRRRRA
jgi:hypothetical protein